MAQITSSIGLVSGIDTGSIINDLISIDSGPVNLLQTQVSSLQSQESAYGTIGSQLSAMQTVGSTLSLPTAFANATATSSNPNILTATTNTNAAVGSYQFQVQQLVSTQQSVSNGFASSTTSPVGAGTITLEEGGGEASSQTLLSQLNGGAGIASGQFRVTDASGNSAVIDTSSDITLDDVIKQINNAQGISVTASIGANGLVLTDESGGTGTLTVKDLSGGTTAESLGIAGSATAGVITGTNINQITSTTPLSQLNDDNGISTAAAGNSDFQVTLADGTQVSVFLNGASTVGDVLNDINNAAGAAGKLTASINPAGNGIQLTDTSGGAGTLSVTAQNGSLAASQLGFTAAATGTTIGGSQLVANLDSVLVSSLNGGNGFTLGTLNITNHAGATATVNLSGAKSVSDIINAINNSGIDVTASLNAAGTGLEITDGSTGTGSLVIADADGSQTAEDLGIAGNFTASTVDGKNLQRQYISANTPLSFFDGGNGVGDGQFRITNSLGASKTIDLSTGSFNTVGDVLNAINGANMGVTASIDATGNGIQLTDTAGGANKMTVTDLSGGTTAQYLNIAGTAAGAGADNTIDGALQKTITVTSADTLASLQTKINDLGFGITASIINDGSGSSPYRLSLSSINSGTDGRVLIDSGSTNLGITTLVKGQDAAVFYGGGGSAAPLLITSNTNQLTNLIRGVTVSLVGASSTPTTLTISPDASNVENQLQNFVTAFNSAATTIGTDTTYNTATNQGGVLLGDATTQQIESTLYSLLNTVVKGAGSYQTFADVGITINTDGSTGEPQISFDPSTFETAFATNPAAVTALFTQTNTGLGSAINTAMDKLTDPQNGVITLSTNTINTQITQFQDQITTLNSILAEQRTQLETQFNDMETTLASLQSQQAVLAGFTGSSASTKTAASDVNTSSSSSSSSSS